MKRFFAICCVIMLSSSLTISFMNAEKQEFVQEIEQASQFLEDSQINLNEVNLEGFGDISDISVDDIEFEEKEEGMKPAKDLTLKDKFMLISEDLPFKEKLLLLLAFIKIKTSECTEPVKHHILRNKRKYIFGAGSALIFLIAATIYYKGSMKHL